MIVVVEKPMPSLGTIELPPDLDTTSIGFTVTQTDNRVINEVLDEMLQYVTHDGMVMVNPTTPTTTARTTANPLCHRCTSMQNNPTPTRSFL
jgi:hypothetical protein